MIEDSQNKDNVSELTVPEELSGKTLEVAHQPRPEQDEDAPSKLTTPESKANENLQSFAQHTHSYISDYITLSDTKAAFVFAVGAGLLVYLYQKNFARKWLKSIELWSLVDFITFIAMLGLAASCFAAIAVVFPRLRGSRRGHLFWGGIAKFDSPSEYANSAANLTEDGIVNETLKHNYCHVKLAMSYKR